MVEPSIVDQVSLAADAITTARRRHPGSAVSIIESALPVLQGRVVEHHADVGRGLNELANAHMSAGVRGVMLGGCLGENDAWSPLWCVQRWPEALELVKQSVPIFEKVYPDGHPLRGLQVPWATSLRLRAAPSHNPDGCTVQWFLLGKLQWYCMESDAARASLAEAVSTYVLIARGRLAIQLCLTCAGAWAIRLLRTHGSGHELVRECKRLLAEASAAAEHARATQRM